MNNKYFKQAQMKLKLSEDNVDRRKKVCYFEQGDRDLIEKVQKRIDIQERLNKEVTQSA